MRRLFEAIKKKISFDHIKSRFEAKVKKQGGHWSWTGHVSRVTGKPQFWYDGEVHPAQRISWLIYKGSSPDPGQIVKTTCGKKNCVNPEHLSLGSKTRPLKIPNK